jgi:flagella basal body P-ring formation protein FlgA
MKTSTNLAIKFYLTSVCIAAMNVAATQGAELQLRPEIHTQKNILTLSDVAEIFTGSSQEAAMLAAVELMPAPAPGTRLSIRMREIQDFLSMRGVNLTNVQFTGSEHVVVIGGADPTERLSTRRPSKVLMQQAQRVAVDAIIHHLRAKAGASDDWQVAVELEDGQVAPLVAAGDSIKVAGGAEPWIGNQSFEFRLPTAAGAARLEIAAQVSLPPAVVIAMHVLPKGTIVRACDVQLKRLKPGVAPGELYQTIEDVVGKEAVRNIPVGQTLDANFVHAPLLVRSGEVVTVSGRNGAILVRMPARAREDGAEGELVSVESLLDRQTFLARVSALHEVEVYAGATAIAPAGASSTSRQSIAADREAVN